MKILITGSHFTPAQAVIEQLQKHPAPDGVGQDLEIVYVGRKTTREGDKAASVESKVLPGLGIKFIPIISGRLQRSFTIHTIPSLFKIPIGFLQSFYIVLREKPDVVLSFGGYVAVPVVISSWLLSIPIIVHEQTLVSGLANTISSWFANKIAVTFEENKSFDNNKTILTGNPMRIEMINTDKKQISTDIAEIVSLAKKENLPLILITGGNQGSHVINSAALGVLEELTKKTFVIHQTGDSKFQDFERLTAARLNLKNPGRYMVKKWIEGNDMGFIFQNTDLVVSRSGINTLLELAYFGIPSLVIPLPYLYKNEQNVNAKYFEKLGLVEILSQKELSSQNLLKSILSQFSDLDKFKEKAKRAKEVVVPDAAKRLALETLLLGRKEG